MFGILYSRESIILIYSMYKYVIIIILIMLICTMNSENNGYQLKIMKQIPTDNYESPEVTLYWFHRPSCPYCVEMKDAWRGVENHLTNTNIKTEKIDIGKSDNIRHAMLKNQYNVQSVPTIIKEYADGTHDKYDGARTTKDIIAWSKQ